MGLVPVRFTKWEDRPHWTFVAHHLGADEHGRWLGVPSGTLMTRPGLEVLTTYESVLLVPTDRPYLALFMARPATTADENPPQVYVDVTTLPISDQSGVTAVDLDLDVVRLLDGTTYVDDEDEFAEHQQRYGYPARVIQLAEATSRQLVAEVGARVEPFGIASQRWLRTSLERLTDPGAAPPPAP